MFPWVRSFSLLERHSESEGSLSATPATGWAVEDCNCYHFVYHQHQLNVTLASRFPERRCRLQTRKTKLVISTRLGKVRSRFLKPESFLTRWRSTLEDQRACVKSRELVAWRGLEGLKSILHHKLTQEDPASRVRERLKILESCE